MMHNSMAAVIALALVVMVAISLWRIVLLVLASVLVAVFGLGLYQLGHALHL